MATGALFAGLAVRIGYRAALPAFLVFLAGLLALSFIDVEHLILPKRIVYFTLAIVAALLVVAAGATNAWDKLAVAAICAVVWFVGFLLLNLISPRLIGFGDVRLALLLGLGLGWLGWRYAVLGFFVANVIGSIVGLMLIGVKKMAHDQPIPYAAFLSVGAAVAIFAGPEIIASIPSFH